MNKNSHSNPGLALISATVLYLAFALTGFATALLGATLPAMLAHWSLNDRQGGLLFLLLFLGSSAGALLSRGRATHSVARGSGLLFPSCMALGFTTGRAIFPLFFLFGLGLGITITSINLLRSQRRAQTRARELNRLNLIWASGAFCCPWLANQILRLTSGRCIFLLMAAMFAAFTVWVLFGEIRVLAPAYVQPLAARGPMTQLPIVIALVTFLATGLESSTGAWIATYGERLRNGLGAPVAEATIFWFGLLASRALHSTAVIQHFKERMQLKIGISIAALGCIFLLASSGPGTLRMAGFLIGFGVGPVYPLLLASVLPRVSGNTIFLMAGLGGATFPWLVGNMSAREGSLRMGMITPAVAGIVMLALIPKVSDAIQCD